MLCWDCTMTETLRVRNVPRQGSAIAFLLGDGSWCGFCPWTPRILLPPGMG